MQTYTYLPSDEIFLRELKKSRPWHEMIAAYLRCRGLSTELLDLRVRPSFEERHAYTQDANCFVEGLPVEIKTRTKDFYTPDSFPYDTIMVDAPHVFEKKKIKPVAYIMFSKYTCGMIWLDVRETVSSWWIEEITSENWQTKTRYYTASKHLFQPMTTFRKFIIRRKKEPR